MSQITKGEVVLTLADAEYTLTPSLNAFSRLSAVHKNHNALLEKVREGDVMTILSVIRLGLGWDDKAAKKLPDLIFKTGVGSLIEPTWDYVFRLFNGGKTLDEVLADQSAEEGEEASTGEEPDPFAAALG